MKRCYNPLLHVTVFSGKKFKFYPFFWQKYVDKLTKRPTFTLFGKLL